MLVAGPVALVDALHPAGDAGCISFGACRMRRCEPIDQILPGPASRWLRHRASIARQQVLPRFVTAGHDDGEALVEGVGVRVVAADGISRSGAEALLWAQPGISVVPAGGDGAASAAVLLLVADVFDDAAVSLARGALSGLSPKGRVGIVAVVGRMAPGVLPSLVDLGVGALVWRRQATGEAVARAVRAVDRGAGVLMPPEVVRDLLDYIKTLRRGEPRPKRGVAVDRSVDQPALTARESDVLRLLADGFDTAQAATALAYSDRTVKNILHELTIRMRLRNRTHAVAYALREGLI
ncbi:DNA-binding NarL/FixJ family response regulator [Catenulispora sp. EB89]|uniref:helix-turn-helix transcriptional regulator n=1 Tax=Catenulispora sp. EB89 TaxID=3156257 RepID=UPI0035115EC6